MKWLWTLIALLAAGFIQRMYFFGAFDELAPNYIDASFSHGCTPIPSAPGPEDITIDAESGMAFISAYNKEFWMQGIEDPQAGIYTLDTRSGQMSMDRASIENFPEDTKLYPHGIGIFRENSQLLLFVVNHREFRKDAVEVFEYKDKKLNWLRAYMDPLLYSVNDVIPVSPTSFYATNDHWLPRNALLQLIEDVPTLCWSQLIYYNGAAGSVAASNFCFANGVNVSPDGEYVYVSETLSYFVNIFKRDKATGKLDLRKRIFTGTGVDNIEVEGNKLFIGSHPNIWKFAAFLVTRVPSPSEVIVIHLETPEGAHSIKRLFMDNGQLHACTSVAAPFDNGKILIGSALVQEHVLLCS